MNAEECPELTTLKTEAAMFTIATIGDAVQRRVTVVLLTSLAIYTQVARLHKQIIVDFSLAEQTSVKYAVNNAFFVDDI